MKLIVTHPTLEELFKDFYAIPEFQREYVWEEEQVRALLEDAFDALFDENGSVIDTEYFIGSIVAYREHDVFQLIDGQQRSTTIFIILCAIRDALLRAGKDEDVTHLQGLIRDTYQDDLGSTQQRFRLVPLYQDAGNALLEIGNGTDADTDDRRAPASALKMRLAYRIAREFLERFSDDTARIRLFQARFTRSYLKIEKGQKTL